MKLVIIAGGKGTRLGAVDVPKPMVQIAGRPLLQWQIELAARYGLKDVIILSGHLSHVIREYFGDGSRWGGAITHCVETEPRGTAGALKQAEGMLQERFMVLYGDIVLDMDLARFIRYDAATQGIATLVVHPNDHPGDSDLIETDAAGAITRLHPKPHADGRYYRNLVNAGVYILSPEIFRHIPGGVAIDFGKDVFPALACAGARMNAYRTSEYIKDMGTPDRFEKTQRDILDGKVARRNFRNSRPCIFLDRDGVLNRDSGNICRADRFELLEGAGEAVRRINASDYLAVVVTNQPVIAKGMCTESELGEIHNKMETLLGRKGAYLDGIYYCPHHPEKGFPGEAPAYKIACGCRKPAPGLIHAALRDFSIDLAASFIIGDRAADIQAGLNAGVKTVLVRTGYAGRDCVPPCVPQYVFENLGEAVAFILGDYERLRAVADEVARDAVAGGKPPLVAVGGLSRSGKTTFCRVLAEALERRGAAAKILSLDNWLLDIAQRREEMTVRERYRYADIAADLEKLLAYAPVKMNRYDPLTRKVVPDATALQLAPGEILIVDGVVALDLASVREKARQCVHVQVPEDRRRERFIRFYRHKGLREREILDLYERRQADEYPVVTAARTFADRIVCLEDAQ